MRSVILISVLVGVYGCVALHKEDNDAGETSNNSSNPTPSYDSGQYNPTNPTNTTDSGNNNIGQYNDASKPTPINYGPWSDCFDPTEKYPTGVLKYPDCTAYCQSVGKSCSVSNCLAPDSNSINFSLGTANVLVWCNLPAGTCGNLSSFPNYVSICNSNTYSNVECVESQLRAYYGAPYQTGICTTNWNYGSYVDYSGPWWDGNDPGTRCPNPGSLGPTRIAATSAQCCCN